MKPLRMTARDPAFRGNPNSTVPAHLHERVIGSLPAIALGTALALGACAAPPVAGKPAPSAVTIARELAFPWHPPNGGPAYEISIAAGRYARADDDGDRIYYTSENGLVSRARRGQAAARQKGGIGYSRKSGSFFVWSLAPSFDSKTLLNGVLDEFEAGPPVRIYLGDMPERTERSLQLER